MFTFLKLCAAATKIITASRRAKWRTYVSQYLLDEIARVLVEQLDFSKQFANLTRRRALSRSTLVKLRSTA